LRGSTFDVMLFAVYTLASVTGLLLMKAWLPQARFDWIESGTLGWPAVLALIGTAFYGISFLVWLAILTRQEVSLAYPLIVGLTLLFLSLGSALLLAENLTTMRIAGMCLILAGVVLLAQS
jgi:multidrug transporter EmrE-like cation transporter